MSRYDDWFVPSLDIELMRSGAIRRQHQLAYTFPMSTSLLTMIVFCFGNLQLSSPVSNGLLLGGPHARTSPVLDIYMAYKGLVGARSRLFFLLLLTIRTIQILVGISSVRFLVENAGSMKDVHFVAFCKLLGLPFKEPFDQYTWDLAEYTCFITRNSTFSPT